MNVQIDPASARLAGYWKLNETSGTTAADATVNANNGILMNMAGNEWITIFTENSNSLTGVFRSSIAWGDYDNDGDLDILLTGDIGSSEVSKIYKNNNTMNSNMELIEVTIDTNAIMTISTGDTLTVSGNN